MDTLASHRTVVIAMSFVVSAAASPAATLSEQGEFQQDDDVALVAFNVSMPFDVVIESLGYAGGVNGDGISVPAGGFDPVLSLFDANGLLIAEADDGREVVDPSSGEAFDSLLSMSLPAGSYTVALTQFDNYAIGPMLEDGFERVGEGNFTSEFGPGPAFNDFDGVRTGRWALDITIPQIPEPATIIVLAMGALCGCALRRARF